MVFRWQKWNKNRSQNGSYPKKPPNKKTRFSLHNFNTFSPSEAMFSKPKTVETRQRNHVSTVEALFRIRRTQKSTQHAPKRRRDGPDERFCSFLNAKMATQNAPKSKKILSEKQPKNIMQKACRKITVPERTRRGSTMQPRSG